MHPVVSGPALVQRLPWPRQFADAHERDHVEGQSAVAQDTRTADDVGGPDRTRSSIGTLNGSAPLRPPPPTASSGTADQRGVPASPRPTWGWFSVSATMLVPLAPLLVIAATPLSDASSPAWVWAWLLTMVVGLRYAWLVAAAPQRLFELVVWLFTYVFLGLAPLAQMRSGTYPGTTPDLDTSLNGVAMGVVWAGAAAFALGLALRPPGPHRPRTPAAEMSNHRLLAFTALAVLFSAYYASRIGVGTLFSTRAERVAVENLVWSNSTVLAVVKAAATLPLIVAFSALVRLRRQRRAAGRRGPLLLLVLVLVTMSVAVSPVSSPRYLFGTAALAVVVALGAAATPRRARWFALLLAAGLVLVFPYADATRRPGPAEVKLGPAQSLSSSDFDAFDMVNNSIAYVRSEGITGGRQAVGAALFWVPRTVWENKPRDTGILLADFRDYAVSNLSSPLWAELFIDGGWALVIVGMTGLGLLVRRLDRDADASGDSPSQGGVLADILPFYFIIMLRGSLLQSMAGFTVLALSGLFVTARRRRSA
jgi:hypothetical protein